MRSVFLKQFPAVEGSEAAALQQITETSYVIRRLRARPLGGTYWLDVHPMNSHPLTEELGLESQAIGLAYRLRDGLRRPRQPRAVALRPQHAG